MTPEQKARIEIDKRLTASGRLLQESFGGNSQGVRLPKTVLDMLFLRENDSVEIVAENNSIIIRKSTRSRRAKKSLEERFKNYTGDYKCAEWDTGKPVGKEVW